MARPGSRTGNAGLASPEQMVTAAPGFRSLKVTRIDRESSSVVSLVLEPADARPLTVPLAGQFVVLRLRPKADAPPVLRSYSLSGLPDARRYRISVKEEPHGVASTHVSTQLRTGDVLDISEPRGAFTLRRGDFLRCIERGRRRDSGDGHAPCAGSSGISAPDLVDFWRAEPRGSSLCPGARELLG